MSCTAAWVEYGVWVFDVVRGEWYMVMTFWIEWAAERFRRRLLERGYAIVEIWVVDR